MKIEDLAIIGAHFMNNNTIQDYKYQGYLTTILSDYNPDMYNEAIQAYNSITDEQLKCYLEYITSFSEETLRNIQNIAIEAEVNKSISAADIDNLMVNISDLSKEYLQKDNKPISLLEASDKVIIRKKYSTGNLYFDGAIGSNGFEEGRCYVFASKAKGGKSILLQNLAAMLSYRNEAKVLYLSLENNYNDIVSREKEFKYKDTSKYNVLYDPHTNIETIKMYCKEYDIVIVDYLARIVPEKQQETDPSYIMFGDMVDKLHYIADQTNSVIITACQLNRSALNVFKTETDFEKAFLQIDQDNVSDSMGIVRNADSVSITWLHEGFIYLHNIASRLLTTKGACKIAFVPDTLRLSIGGKAIY